MSAESELPPLDVERIVAVLNRHAFDFVIVGGVAGQLHGALRVTEDLDAVVEYRRENLKRVIESLRELGARLRAEGFDDTAAKAVAAAMVHPDTLIRGEMTTWTTDAGPLDILHDIPDRDGTRRTYEELARTARSGVVAGLIVKVVGLGELIASTSRSDGW